MMLAEPKGLLDFFSQYCAGFHSCFSFYIELTAQHFYNVYEDSFSDAIELLDN
jgi:hypothetical protein